MQTPQLSLEDFSGVAPLFPLPNAVLFPKAILPLHIFEPRYRQMTADALAGDSFMAIALRSTPSSETPPGQLPPIHSMVGLGRIVAHEKLADGRYYLFLHGLTRARVIREIPSPKLYRIGELELCVDDVCSVFGQEDELRSRLIRSARGVLERKQLQAIFGQGGIETASVASLCDLIAANLPLPAPMLQSALDELNVATRAGVILRMLEQLGDNAAPFPPAFSPN